MKNILFVLLLSSQFVSAQWTHYTSSNTTGLIATCESDVVETYGNYKYFATENGVYRYSVNDNLWTSYQDFASNTITDLFYDGYYLWAATNGGGAYKSTYSGGSWNQVNSNDGLAGNIVKGITRDNDLNYWFATYSGISRLNGTTWTTFNVDSGLPTNLFNCAFKDSQNNLWFGTSSKGVVKYNGTNWITYNVVGGLAGNTVLDVYEDSSNRIWVCTTNGASIIVGGIITQNITSDSGLSGEVAYCVNQISPTVIHVGTNNGVTVFSNTLTITDTLNNLYGPEIITILYSNGIEYFGHENNGLTVIDNGNMINYSNWDGLIANYIYAIGETSDENIWFAHNSGVTKHDGIQWNNYNESDGLPITSANSLAIDSSDNILITSYSNSLYSFNQETCEQIPVPVIPNNSTIYKVQVDQYNRLWTSFNCCGAAFYDGSTWTSFTINNPLSYFVVEKFLIVSPTETWFATNHALFHLNGGVWRQYNDGNGFSDNITDVVIDNNGLIWASCSEYEKGGLYTFNGTDWNRNLVNTKYVKFVYIDSEGSIWCGGNSYGIQNQLTQYKNGIWYYHTIDPYSTSININCFFEDSHNNLWVGTNQGVYSTKLSIVNASTESADFNGLSIYPNPSNDIFSIETNITKPTSLNITIYNLQGQLVFEENITDVPVGPFSKSLSASGFSQGIYSCVVRNETEVSKTKLIILK